MRTGEDVRRLPLQSPRFLLGLLRLLLADGRSRGLAPRTAGWIKPLAMAAAMGGRPGSGGGGTERGGAEGPRRGTGRRRWRLALGEAERSWGQGAGALSPTRLSPSPRSAGPGAQMRPGRGGSPRWRPRVGAGSGARGCGRRRCRGTAARPSAPGGQPPLARPRCPSRLRARGRAGRPRSKEWRSGARRVSASVRPGRAGRDSAPDSSCPPAGAGAAAAACSRILPVIVKCFGNQHLERAIFSQEISNPRRFVPTHSTSRPPPSGSVFRKKKRGGKGKNLR